MAVKSPEYVKWSEGDHKRNFQYPRYFWYFLTAAFALLLLIRVINIFDRYFLNSGKFTRKVRMVSNVRNGYNKYIGYLKIQMPYFSCHLGDLLLLVIYTVIVITFCFNDTPDSPPPIHYGYANRSGMITFATTPFVVALAGRNNIISFLLGIPYERLRIYHFWCSRITLLTTLIHSIGRIKISSLATWIKPSNQWGMVGFIAGCLIFLGSFPFLLKSRYEIFFVFHLVTVVIFIVGSWFHQPDNRHWLYGAIAVWALDRVFRIVRMVAFDGILRFKKSHSIEAKIEKVSKDTVRIELVKPDLPSWKAGSHVFISSVGLHWFPQGHPFTIASIPINLTEADSVSITSSEENEKKILASPSEASLSSESRTTLVFIIRARDGWTKHLLKFAEEQEKDQRLRLLIDGPYSPPDSIDHFEKVVLFAGGSGVSWTLPLLLDLVSKSQIDSKLRVKKLIWIWIIRDSSHLSWIGKDLLSALRTLRTSSSSLKVEIKVFSTGNQSESLLDLEKDNVSINTISNPPPGSNDLLSQLRSFDEFSSTSGKPKLDEILKDSISKSRGKKVFVGSSGPTKMTDELRETSRKLMKVGFSTEKDDLDLTFKAEEFGW